MKATTLKKAALIAGSLSFLAGSAFSQTAVSGAGGYKTETLENGFNLLGITLHSPVATSGAIASESGDTVTVSSPADLTAVLPAGPTYLVEILDGAQAGVVDEISNITMTTFDVAGGLGAGTAAYQIRAAATLDSTFGSVASPSTGLFPDANTDVVWIPNPASPSGFDKRFVNNGGEWRDADAPFGLNLADSPLNYITGVFYENAGAQKPLVITGMVKTTSTVVAANEGFNLAGITPPVGATLGNSGLANTFNPSTGLFPDANTDIVWIPNSAAASGFDKRFVNNGGEWRDADAPFGLDLSGELLTSGVFIERAAGNGDTGAPVDVPPFYANL